MGANSASTVKPGPNSRVTSCCASAGAAGCGAGGFCASAAEHTRKRARTQERIGLLYRGDGEMQVCCCVHGGRTVLAVRAKVFPALRRERHAAAARVDGEHAASADDLANARDADAPDTRRNTDTPGRGEEQFVVLAAVQGVSFTGANSARQRCPVYDGGDAALLAEVVE